MVSDVTSASTRDENFCAECFCAIEDDDAETGRRGLSGEDGGGQSGRAAADDGEMWEIGWHQWLVTLSILKGWVALIARARVLAHATQQQSMRIREESSWCKVSGRSFARVFRGSGRLGR